MNHHLPWVAERVRLFRESDADFARWARGYGPIVHNDQTQLRVHELAQVLVAGGKAATRRASTARCGPRTVSPRPACG
jgi:hypothetical protein